MINWKVRIRNRLFWVTVIPALLLIVQTVASLFGFEIDLSTIQGKLIAVVDAVFGLLTALGLVVDFTTEGVEDSARAMQYEYPYPKDASKPPEEEKQENG